MLSETMRHLVDGICSDPRTRPQWVTLALSMRQTAAFIPRVLECCGPALRTLHIHEFPWQLDPPVPGAFGTSLDGLRNLCVRGVDGRGRSEAMAAFMEHVFRLRSPNGPPLEWMEMDCTAFVPAPWMGRVDTLIVVASGHRADLSLGLRQALPRVRLSLVITRELQSAPDPNLTLNAHGDLAYTLRYRLRGIDYVGTTGGVHEPEVAPAPAPAQRIKHDVVGFT
jgi:hypothetical protein